jgi:hypothetical protein
MKTKRNNSITHFNNIKRSKHAKRSKNAKRSKHAKLSKKTFNSRRHTTGPKINNMIKKGGAIPDEIKKYIHDKRTDDTIEERIYTPYHILYNYNACGKIVTTTEKGIKPVKTITSFKIKMNPISSDYEKQYKTQYEGVSKILDTLNSKNYESKKPIDYLLYDEPSPVLEFIKIKKGICKGDKVRTFSFHKLNINTSKSNYYPLYTLVYSEGKPIEKEHTITTDIHNMLRLIKSDKVPKDDKYKKVKGMILLQQIRFITFETDVDNKIIINIYYFDTNKQKIREMKLKFMGVHDILNKQPELQYNHLYNFVGHLCLMVACAKDIFRTNYGDLLWADGIHRIEFLEDELNGSESQLCIDELDESSVAQNSGSVTGNNVAAITVGNIKSIEDILRLKREIETIKHESEVYESKYQMFNSYDIMYGYNIALYKSTLYPELFQIDTILPYRTKYQEMIQEKVEAIEALQTSVIISNMNALNISMLKLKVDDISSEKGKKLYQKRRFFVFKCDGNTSVKYYLIYSFPSSNPNMDNNALINKIESFEYTNEENKSTKLKLCDFPAFLYNVINDDKINRTYRNKTGGKFLGNLKGCLDLSHIKQVQIVRSGLINLIYFNGEKLVKMILKYKTSENEHIFIAYLIKLIAYVKNEIIESKSIQLLLQLNNEIIMHTYFNNHYPSVTLDECPNDDASEGETDLPEQVEPYEEEEPEQDIEYEEE